MEAPEPDDHRPSQRGGPVSWIERITRFGWLGKGFVFVVIGVLAARIASARWSTGSDVQANQQGALRTIADQPLGAVLLTALAAGLTVFAVWKVTQAVVPGSADVAPLGIAKRIGWLGLGVFYGSLAYVAVHLAYLRADDTAGDRSSGGAPGGGGATSPSLLTARLMSNTAGRLLVVVVALVVLIVAAYHLRKGVTRAFVDDIDTDDLSERRERWLGVVGMVGFVARAIVLGVAGWFLLKAAVQFDPEEAVGLDGALRELAMLTYGRAILAIVAAGLVVAGAYDMGTFRRQRMR